MSHPNLLHLTNKAVKDKPWGIPTREVSEVLSSRATPSQFDSWIVNEKNVCKQIANSIVDSSSNFVESFKNIILIAEAKVCEDSRYDKILGYAFKYVIELNPKTDLSIEEIVEITGEENPEDFIIGGEVNKDAKAITLYRGDFSRFVVSFDRFKKNAKSTPDFSKFKIIDDGRAIKLGSYEASIYPLLYELDPQYRKRINKQRKSEDKSFGACLYRAREIRNLNQGDFPGVRRETIIRIESGKSKNVRAQTKQAILKALNLRTEEELLGY